MIISKISAIFMAIISFFNILFAGYIKYFPNNRIFLNAYYTESKSERQSYDLVIPKDAKGDIGLVLCIHGGGWIAGSKDSYTENILKLSEENGVAGASISYRYVSDSVNFDNILDDITSALDSIKAKGKEYGVNFTKVILTGTSAGGHLSLLYAYTKQIEAPITPVCVVELCGPTDLEDSFYYSEDNIVAQAVGVEYLTGIIGNGIGSRISLNDFDKAREQLKKYSPINYVDSNTVATFFGHGEQDTLVPYKNSLDLDKKLSDNNVEHKFVSFPNSSHGCEDKSAQNEIMRLFFECVEKYLKG